MLRIKEVKYFVQDAVKYEIQDLNPGLHDSTAHVLYHFDIMHLTYKVKY